MNIQHDLRATDLATAITRLFSLAAQKTLTLGQRWQVRDGAPVVTANGKYIGRNWTQWTQGFAYGNAILCFDITDQRELLKLGLDNTIAHMAVHVNWMIRQQKAGIPMRQSIINISSVSATVASVNRGDYCISKAGIAMTTRLWAARLTQYGIGVYEVRPGIIATDMTKGVQGKYDALMEGDLFLDKRWGTPDDVGTAVAMLASGGLPYSPGAVLILDGGITLPRL